MLEQEATQLRVGHAVVAEHQDAAQSEAVAQDLSHAPIISLRNISRSYVSHSGVETQVFKDVNLDIHPGEFVVIRGESGSGKTTLLRILGLLDNGFSGSYTLGGTPVSGRPGWWLDEARAANIGFVFQEGRLFDHLTLEKNVTVPYRLSGGEANGAKLREEIKAEAADFFSGQEFNQDILSQRPQKVSGGQRQRIAIMRAIKRHPPIILADEPTASLDADRKGTIVMLLQDACRDGHTVIIVSHDSIFFDTGRQLEMTGGVLHEVQPASGNTQATALVKPIKTDFSARQTWRGLKPRADLLTLLRQTMQETFGRPVFLFLIMVALLAGICQISIFASLLTGTQDFIEASIKSGSRLNRVEIRPKLTDRENGTLFPEFDVIRANPAVEAVVPRRETTVRLQQQKAGNFLRFTGMGLQFGDPEYGQLFFYAGGRFSRDAALEIILTANILGDLFDTTALQEGREGFADFIGRPLTIHVPQFTSANSERGTVRVQVKVAGIIAAGEGGRQLYLPITTILAMDQVKRDRTGTQFPPLNETGDGWTVEEEAVRAFASFPWEDRLQIYTHKIRDVIPIFGEMARLGYRPQSDIWKYRWVLVIQDVAVKIFVPLLALIVFGVGLTVFTNIYSSAKMREKDFALWRILGMRVGDLCFTQLFSTMLVVGVGTLGGLLMAGWLIEEARGFLLASAQTANQPETTQNLEMIFSPIMQFAPFIFVGSMIIGILGAIIPAARAAYTDPAKILQSG